MATDDPNVTLDHCVVHVSDWERSNRFYRDVLQAELVRRGAGWAYRFGTAQLNIHGPGVDATPLARLGRRRARARDRQRPLSGRGSAGCDLRRAGRVLWCEVMSDTKDE